MTARYLSLIFPYSLVVLLTYQSFFGLNLATLAPTMACATVILCVAALAAFRQIPKHRYTHAALAGSLAVCGLYLLTCNEWVEVIGDNIAYIRDARRLVQGKGVLDSQYGLGVKSMLIPAVVLFPDSVPALKATIAVSGFLFPFCTFMVFREFVDNNRALLMALISGAFWLAVRYSNVVTADMPFPAFSLLALWAILQYIRRPGISWKWLIAAACAVGWAYHVKSPSIYLVIAAAIYLGLRKEVKKPLLLAVFASVWVLPWAIYLKVNFPESQGYLGMTNQIARGVYIPEGEVGTFWQNFSYYIFRKNPADYLKNLEYFLLPSQFRNELPVSAEWRPLGWFILALIAIGFVFGRKPPDRRPISLLRSLEVHDWYVMGYTATLFTLPGSPDRYLLPVLPIIVFYIFKGVDGICNRFPESIAPRRRSPRYLPLEKILVCFQRPVLVRHSPVFLACVFLLPSLFVDFETVRARRMTPGYGTFWKTYYEASVWMRDNTPAQSRVTTRKPGLVWFWSEREANGYPRIKDPAKGLDALKKFDYILLDNIPNFHEKFKYIVPALEAYPNSFAVMHTTESPETYVIKIVRNVP
ncbi:MAG: glycosyltransferase family 39 protein [Gemmatimonadota bacterium]|nr:glycosyltransferase family 39 protein [Gemmatimonadota bacterium]